MPAGVYVRTKPAWNKGLTAATDARIAQGARKLIGRAVSEETRLRMSYARKGRKPTKEAIAAVKAGIAKAGGAWNKGLTKETHTGIAKGAKKLSLINTGKKLNIETRKRQSGHRGKYRETGKRSAVHKQRWQTLSIQQQNEFIKKWRSITSRRPNGLEQLLNNILQTNFSNEWQYVGNGKLIIGGFIPDFVSANGHKAVIEAYGEYWHKDDNPQDRIDKYAELGYRCLVVWERDIRTNPAQVIEQVRILTGGS